jgi:hypothetical protein
MLQVEAQDLNRRESPSNPHLNRATAYLQLLKQMQQSSGPSKLNSRLFNQEDSGVAFLISRESTTWARRLSKKIRQLVSRTGES